MLDTVTAIRFAKVMGTGRTKPCLIGCAYDDGREVEAVVKFQAGCDLDGRSLVNEALAALLAAELGLPVPEPFVVMVDAAFASIIPDNEARALATKSIGPNFGSKLLPPGYSTIPADFRPKGSLQTVAEILAFDVLIENSDRRMDNPNLLLKGEELAIYDHEMAFHMDMVIGWEPPWQKGAVARFPLMDHALYHLVRGKELDFARITSALNALEVNRLREYGQSLPDAWIDEGVAVESILGYISELKEHASEAVENIKDALR